MAAPRNTAMPASAPPSRRHFILALASCAAAMASPAGMAAAPPPTASQVRQFTALCNALAGTQVTNDALVAQYLAVLAESLDPPQRDALRALAALPADAQQTASLAPATREAAELALQLWMSGMAGDGRVLTYLDAPVWPALTFTKPPSVCGGAFGYWAEKPV